jgi:GNAT superfamily N-acetyltransferase
MSVKLRPGVPDDAAVCGQICYEAFGALAAAHGFPSDFPSAEVAIGLAGMMLGHPGFYSLVAEVDGQVVGSNFLDERSPIVGVGPITVAPAVQDDGIGRMLMDGVLVRAVDRGAPGVRLVQAAYHNRSLALYAKLGFSVQESLACMQGPAVSMAVPGYAVRSATPEDIAACDALCRRVHGHHRHGEVADAVNQNGALVVEHDDRISGYSTGLANFAHTVGETNEDLKALIGAASEFAGPGILVPLANSELVGWCLASGLRVVQLMTLMTIGLYNEPAGSYLPSIHY